MELLGFTRAEEGKEEIKAKSMCGKIMDVGDDYDDVKDVDVVIGDESDAAAALTKDTLSKKRKKKKQKDVQPRAWGVSLTKEDAAGMTPDEIFEHFADEGYLNLHQLGKALRATGQHCTPKQAAALLAQFGAEHHARACAHPESAQRNRSRERALVCFPACGGKAAGTHAHTTTKRACYTSHDPFTLNTCCLPPHTFADENSDGQIDREEFKMFLSEASFATEKAVGEVVAEVKSALEGFNDTISGYSSKLKLLTFPRAPRRPLSIVHPSISPRQVYRARDSFPVHSNAPERSA